jgi:hypothetical protein
MLARAARFCLCTAFLALAGSASVAVGQDHLAAAERAYDEVNFEEVAQRAQLALEDGGLQEEEVARVYELLGLARAVAGDSIGSREAFKLMLAILPESEVDRDQPPRLRAPFLEAIAFWDSRRSGFEVEVRASRARSGLRVELSDPLRMAAAVEVYVRDPDTPGYRLIEVAPRRSQIVTVDALGDGDEVQYYASIVDAYGNRLLGSASEDNPHIITPLPSTMSSASDQAAGARDWYTSPWLWTGAGLLLAGAGVGTYLLVTNPSYNLQSRLNFQAR